MILETQAANIQTMSPVPEIPSSDLLSDLLSYVSIFLVALMLKSHILSSFQYYRVRWYDCQITRIIGFLVKGSFDVNYIRFLILVILY